MGSVHGALATKGGLLHLLICSPHMPNDYSFLCTSLYPRIEKKKIQIKDKSLQFLTTVISEIMEKPSHSYHKNVKVKHMIYPF